MKPSYDEGDHRNEEDEGAQRPLHATDYGTSQRRSAPIRDAFLVRPASPSRVSDVSES